MSNLEEYLAGTEPNKPASALRFESVSRAEEGIELHFQAMANRSYTVQFQPDCSESGWAKLQDVAASPEPHTVTVPDQTAGSRFYRIVTPAVP